MCIYRYIPGFYGYLRQVKDMGSDVSTCYDKDYIK